MRILMAAGFLGLIAGCAATPDVAAGPAAPAVSAQLSGPAPAVAAGDERVCKRIEVMGSIRPKRVCASASEWAAQEQQDLENQEEFERGRRQADGARSFE